MAVVVELFLMMAKRKRNNLQQSSVMSRLF